jgi:adenylylsulfate kinase
MKKSKFHIVWLSGMSGAGKSTLAYYIKNICDDYGYTTRIIDGDDVREKDKKKLGFSYEEILINNMRIAKYCHALKDKKVNIAIVPVISPYEKIRKKVGDLLEPNLHLIYLKADIASLRKRDTKGLYLASDRGEINNLIGYSDFSPYEEPMKPSLIICTGEKNDINKSKEKILNYFERFIFNK